MFRLVNILLLVFVFKEILLSAIIPIWHTPDEQAHFAQVAYFAEFFEMPSKSPDLNKEIYTSEMLLGTNRDKQGNNKFTYHPEYNIEYTSTLEGRYEQDIRDLPFSYRRELVKSEAAYYPPLYYWLATIPYKIFYASDLIFRIYASRFISIMMGIGTVYFAYLIAKQIFEKNRLLQITLASLVAFHPMFSFVASGVNSDNLLNLLFTTAIYLNILVIKNGIRKKYLIWTGVIVVLLYLTKPQFILVLPVVAFGLIAAFLKSKKISYRFKFMTTSATILVFFIFLALILLTPLYQLIERAYPMSFFPGQFNHNIDPVWFIKDTLIRTARETIPWYFGVFKWLGVVYPIEILRIINRILIILSFGVLLKILIDIYKRKFDALFLFMIFVSVSYYIGIVFYNFLFYSSVNFSFGLQGRYFFPVIVSHMALLLYGLTTLIPGKYTRIQGWGIKILGFGMIVLNIIALGILINSYYSWNDLNILIIQMSQYKPFYFKGYWLYIWGGLFIASISVFVYKYIRLKND